MSESVDKPDLLKETQAGLDAELKKQLDAALAELEQRKKIETDLRTQLASAKTEEDVNKVRSEYEQQMGDMTIKLARANLMREYNLPDTVAPLLVGTDEASLTASAKALVEFKGGPEPKTVQGHDTKRPGAGSEGLQQEAPKEKFNPKEMVAKLNGNSLVMQ